MIVALISQLLVPIYSDFNFFSIAVGNIISSGNWSYFWTPIAEGYGRILFAAITLFGPESLMIFDLIIKVLITSSLFLILKDLKLRDLTHNTQDAKEGSSSLTFFLSLMCAVGMFYGHDLSSIQLFQIFILLLIWASPKMSKLQFDTQYNLISYIALGATIYFCAYIDVRIIFTPICSLLLIGGLNKISYEETKRFLIRLQTIILLMVGLNLFIIKRILWLFANFYEYLKLYTAQIQTAPIGSYVLGLNFSGSAIVLLLFIVLLNKRSYSTYIKIISLVILSIFSEVAFALLPLVAFFTLLDSSTYNIGYQRLEELAFKISSFLDKYFSFTARSFFLLAFTYAQLTGIWKTPITDLLMPAAMTDKHLEDKNCDFGTSLAYGGYIFYRLSLFKDSQNQVICPENRHYYNLYSYDGHFGQ